MDEAYEYCALYLLQYTYICNVLENEIIKSIAQPDTSYYQLTIASSNTFFIPSYRLGVKKGKISHRENHISRERIRLREELKIFFFFCPTGETWSSTVLHWSEEGFFFFFGRETRKERHGEIRRRVAEARVEPPAQSSQQSKKPPGKL